MSILRATIAFGLALLCGCEGQFGVGGLPPGTTPPDGGAGEPPDVSLVDSGEPGGPVPDATVPDGGQPDVGPGDAGPPRIVWKAALAAGDNSITAFDNARETVYGMFLDDGVLPENIVQLSRSGGGSDVRDMSMENLLNGMLELDVGPTDGCALFMTSHGSPSGFYIEGRSTLSPDDLDYILDEACGDRPTVVLVSACYSGVFVDPARAPNRIILTAARSDRTSFGCSADATYTYWDGCLIESFEAGTTWSELYDTVTACVVRREAGGFTPSEPQGFFGEEVQDLGVFYRE